MGTRPYQSLIGCLLYIMTCVRLDVAYIVTQLSRFLNNTGLQHCKAAIWVHRCLKTTRDVGILYDNTEGKIKLEAFTDAGWGSSIDDRRSVSGVMIMIGGGPVVYKSRYQRTVALSTSKAEYIALSLCAQEVRWVRLMLKDLGEWTSGSDWSMGKQPRSYRAGKHCRIQRADEAYRHSPSFHLRKCRG